MKLSVSLPKTMRAVLLENGAFRITTVPVPQPAPGEVLVKIAYSAFNRADLFQSQGKYPLPLRDPPIPGMEFSGTVVEGAWLGEKVCAITPEGGFAEYCAVPASLLLPVSGKLTLKQAACFPEALITAWVSLVHQANLQKGETVLIHGGASGVGVAAIQLSKLIGAKVFATAGGSEKCKLIASLGATAIDYKTQDFTDTFKTDGAHVILDMVGGDYLAKNFTSLRTSGRLCLISFLRGSKMDINLSPILLKRLSIFGSTLRTRPLPERAAFVRKIRQTVWPKILSGRMKPVIFQELALEDAQKGLNMMEENLNLGKILLRV